MAARSGCRSRRLTWASTPPDRAGVHNTRAMSRYMRWIYAGWFATIAVAIVVQFYLAGYAVFGFHGLNDFGPHLVVGDLIGIAILLGIGLAFAARQNDRGKSTPRLFADRRSHRYAFGLERAQGRIQVRGHEVELVLSVCARMKGELRGRQRKDQPSASGVHRLEPEHVAEEGAIGGGV